MFSTTHFHPMIVHFPIALLTIAFVFDFTGLFLKKEKCLSKAGFYLLILGSLGALAAVLTGEFFTAELSGEIGELKEKHELFANISMYTALLAACVRIILVLKKREETSAKWIAFLLLFIAFISVSITGFFGGNMVYNYMIGI